MSAELKFHFDFACPYSFFAWKSIFRYLFKKQFEVCFLVNGDNPFRGLEFSEKIWNKNIEAVKKRGIQIKKPGFSVDSRFLERILEKQEEVRKKDFLNLVFCGIFESGVNLSEPLKLLEYCSQNNFDLKIPIDELEKLKSSTDQPVNKTSGNRMTPSLEFENERIAGCFDLWAIENLLEKI
ncbi:MAG: hypothetical protein HQM08_18675 [Candidatus Riflebacteria bacterium]|nr:hypothetical protein [Candidatus Riflebacteria bacterium]